jgi:hypothetical protein
VRRDGRLARKDCSGNGSNQSKDESKVRKYGHQPQGDGGQNQTGKRHVDDGLLRNDRGASRRKGTMACQEIEARPEEEEEPTSVDMKPEVAE